MEHKNKTIENDKTSRVSKRVYSSKILNIINPEKNDYFNTIDIYNYNNIKNKYKINYNDNYNDNYQQYYTIFKEKEIQKTNNNNKTNRSLFNKNNKTLYNSTSNNNINFDNLNNKYHLLLSENESLKSEKNNLKEKIYIFMKLIKNYSKKLNLIISIQNNYKENNVNSELTKTIIKLNELLNDSKLNENIFQIKQFTPENTFENEKIYKNQILANKNDIIKNKTIQLKNNKTISSKNNNTFKSRNNENSIIFSCSSSPIKAKDSLNKDIEFSIKLNSTNNKNNNEIIINTTSSNIVNYNTNLLSTTNNNSLNISPSINLKDESLNQMYSKKIESIIKDYEIKINVLNNENESLNNNLKEQINNYNIILNKVKNLEKENISLKSKFNEENNYFESNMKLKNKISSYQKELTYKNKIINYLVNLFTRISISSELIKEKNYLKNNIKDYNNINDNNMKNRNKLKKYKSFQKLNNRIKINEFMNNHNIKENKKENTKENNLNEFNNNASDIKEIIKNLDKIDLDNTHENLETITTNKYKTPKNIKRNLLNDYEKNNIKRNYNKTRININNKENNNSSNLTNINSTYKNNTKRTLIINNKNENEKNEENNYITLYVHESTRIKKEINSLDEEIIQLQSKLNQLLRD